MTVSRVLNNRRGVSAATREKVLRIAHEVGYVPNVPARSLASGRTGMLGLVLANARDTYYGEILEGAAHEAEKRGFRLVLHLSGRSDQREISQVASLLGGSVDGLVLVLPRAADRYLETLARGRFPCVLVDHRRYDTPLVSVRATNRAGGEAGTRHLVSLGHRRIGFITGDTGYGCAHERLAGYRAVLEEAGIVYDPRCVAAGDWTEASGRTAAAALLGLDPRPTAIFASNDLMALGAYQVARELGIRVPDDLSVVGYDGRSEADQACPQLTTVRQPLGEMGGEAVRLVLAMLEGRETAADGVQPVIELATELIVRASTAPPSAARSVTGRR
jgi:LacI family transcriptional regulator